MRDVSDLVKSLREFAELPFEGSDADPLIEVMHGLASEAADALETLVKENERLRELVGPDAGEFMQCLVDECSWEITKRKAAECRLAKMAKVVEAAKQWRNDRISALNEISAQTISDLAEEALEYLNNGKRGGGQKMKSMFGKAMELS